MRTLRLTAFFPVLFLSTALLFTACKDDDDDNTDPVPTPVPAATITFATPTSGQVFGENDTIRISGTIVTAAAMHGYRISIRNHDDGTEYFYANESGHGTSAVFDTIWV